MRKKLKSTEKCWKKSFRMDEETLGILLDGTKKAGCRDPSKYLRQLIVSGIPHKTFEIRKALQELTYEINKIGLNVNQITKNHNSLLYSQKDKELLEEDMKRIMALEMELIRTLRTK